MELKQHRIVICAISKRKRKWNGTEHHQDYASEGVSMFISNQYIHNIANINYTIPNVTLQMEGYMFTMINIYTSDISKPKEYKE